jgi:hypothetical protein
MRKIKSPFLKDNPSGTLTKITITPYIQELFKKADKALKNLKED